MPATLYAAQSLMSALSDVLGEPITLDRDGQCTLLFANDVEITLADSPESGLLSLCAPLMSAGATTPSELLRQALMLNHAQLPPGCAVSFDDHGHQLVLLAQLWTETTPAQAFMDCLGSLVELVPQLRQRLSALPTSTRDDTMHLPYLRA